MTYAELHDDARRIAAALQSRLEPGDRALLVHPPGPEFVAALFGCAYAGVVAVPSYPPDPTRLDRSLARFRSIVEDAQVSLALTTEQLLGMTGALLEQAPALGDLEWIATDAAEPASAARWSEPATGPGDLALIQYTSGSTGSPKGVMLSHANVLSQSDLLHRVYVTTPESVSVYWLPMYHDMGLMGAIFQPIYSGFRCVAMSPVSFLQRPFRWLRAISTYRAEQAGGPNFCYELCARKVTYEERATLDLSSWRFAFSAAEPHRLDTIERFSRAFAPVGFKREAFCPCYGLAEATLAVTGSPQPERPVVKWVDRGQLEHRRVVELPEEEGGYPCVGSGHALVDQRALIVDPETGRRSTPDAIGEIWASGPTVAAGYWNRPEESEETFNAHLEEGDGPFMRTGDLGFMDGDEVFVTGRVKDLIIIRGRNLWPQDIEATAARSHPALRPGCGAAFPLDDGGEERLGIAHEVRDPDATDLDEVTAAIRAAVTAEHDVAVSELALLEPGAIPKTSSGKIQRSACREELMNGTLRRAPSQAASGRPAPPSG